MIFVVAKYTLYLDESETFTATNDRFFAIGGVIIESTAETSISLDLDALKTTLWSGVPNPTQFILHEKEISEARRNGKAKNSCYNIFRYKKTYNYLYLNLSRMLKQHNITTMGVCLDIARLKHLYAGETNSQLTIALQMLLENYCHFLMHRNADGDICYESLQEPQNQELRQRFYELEALGTMYYTPRFFQTHIGDIRFRNKAENVVGLQLADFVPNTLARVAAQIDPKHKDFKNTVLKQAYDGGLKMTPKYGLKTIP